MGADDLSYRRLFDRTDRGRKLDERVLLIGAGGIGCELLKNLVLTGFAEIHIVDLDTIDLSNLNRQFLFGHEHIKQPKAKVAKETAEKFNHKGVKIEYYHANIKDPQFDVAFFAGFSVIFNALDNMDARRHVNKMVIAADVAMVDCGTTGFQGHTQIIKKGLYPCYDCSPREAPKSFPVCTIRSTPSQPIHCIVWAKSYLFTEIFGVSEEEVAELDVSEDSENAKEIAKLKEEAEALKNIRAAMGSEDFPKSLFTKVFVDDINRLKAMEGFWEKREQPTPLNYQQLMEEQANISGALTAQDHQKVWTLAESFGVFVDSLRRLTERAKGSASGDVLSFDKDDADAMDFVTSAANLRSHIFGIEPKSRWNVKQMAGNIIPAIATTNAMFAALATLNGYKIVQSIRKYSRWPNVGAVFSNINTERVISKEFPAQRPNPHCAVCGVMWQRLIVNPQHATLQHVVDILKKDYGYNVDEIVIETDKPEVVYEPDFDDNLEVLLKERGMRGGSIITIRDDSDENQRVNLLFALSEKDLPQDAPVALSGAAVVPPIKPKKEQEAPPALEELTKVLKRKRSADDVVVGEPPSKKGEQTNGDSTQPHDVTVIDDDGVINLD